MLLEFLMQLLQLHGKQSGMVLRPAALGAFFLQVGCGASEGSDTIADAAFQLGKFGLMGGLILAQTAQMVVELFRLAHPGSTAGFGWSLLRGLVFQGGFGSCQLSHALSEAILELI